MIVGGFDVRGRPYIQGVVAIPRLNISGPVMFLLDTGADSTCLHSKDSINLEIPRERLGNLAEVGGIGGGAEYFNEDATIYFSDDDRIVGYDIAIGIASSATGGLPALLGRDIFDHWHIEYERRRGMLQCVVRTADHLLTG